MITGVHILPTLSLTLEIQPTTGSAEYYDISVTVDDSEEPEEFNGMVFEVSNEKYYISGIGAFKRGSELKIVATPSDGEALPEIIMDCEPETSRAATVRQRIYEMLLDADIHFQGNPVYILGDIIGRPKSISEDVPIGTGQVGVEVGVAYPTSEDEEYTDVVTQNITVPIRMYVLADEVDEAEWLVAVADRVRAAVSGQNWGLTDFGVLNLSWSWSGTGPQKTQDDRLIYLESSFSVSTISERGTTLYV